MEKSILKSKTFYANLILAVLPLFPKVNEAVQANPEIIGYVFAGLNIFLRLISKDKVYLV